MRRRLLLSTGYSRRIAVRRRTGRTDVPDTSEQRRHQRSAHLLRYRIRSGVPPDVQRFRRELRNDGTAEERRNRGI